MTKPKLLIDGIYPFCDDYCEGNYREDVAHGLAAGTHSLMCLTWGQCSYCNAELPITRRLAIFMLTRNRERYYSQWEGRYIGVGEPQGHLATPCSRYGSTSEECAPKAYRVAYLIARESGEPLTWESLDHCMSLVVNDHDDPQYMVTQYGYSHW